MIIDVIVRPEKYSQYRYDAGLILLKETFSALSLYFHTIDSEAAKELDRHIYRAYIEYQNYDLKNLKYDFTQIKMLMLMFNIDISVKYPDNAFEFFAFADLRNKKLNFDIFSTISKEKVEENLRKDERRIQMDRKGNLLNFEDPLEYL